MSSNKKPWEIGHDELPDGRLVCSDHKLTVCGKCCVDFSFMEEVLDEDNDDDHGVEPGAVTGGMKEKEKIAKEAGTGKSPWRSFLDG